VSSEQLVVAWVGLLLTMVYLFTSKSFHEALTSTSSKPGVVTDADFGPATTAGQTAQSPGVVTL
jgi:hypothetical protein